MSAPFDTARPLWEVQLIDGITEGENPAALLVKFHHAITDGVGGVELFRQLYDFEREVDRGPLPPIPSPEDVSSTDLARNALRRLPLTTALDVAGEQRGRYDLGVASSSSRQERSPMSGSCWRPRSG